MSTSGVWCSGDECLALWPEGPLPAGWTVENVEGRVEPCCPDCTAFYAEQTPPARVVTPDA